MVEGTRPTPPQWWWWWWWPIQKARVGSTLTLSDSSLQELDQIVTFSVEELALEPVTLRVRVHALAVEGVLLPAPLC